MIIILIISIFDNQYRKRFFAIDWFNFDNDPVYLGNLFIKSYHIFFGNHFGRTKVIEGSRYDSRRPKNRREIQKSSIFEVRDPRKLFRIGINMGLLLLKRRPNIVERRERDVLQNFLCRTFKQNWTACVNWTASTHSRQATVSRWVEQNLFSQREPRGKSSDTQRIVFGLASKLVAVEISVDALLWAWKPLPSLIRWFSTFLSKSECIRTVQNQLAYSEFLNMNSIVRDSGQKSQTLKLDGYSRICRRNVDFSVDFSGLRDPSNVWWSLTKTMDVLSLCIYLYILVIYISFWILL